MMAEMETKTKVLVPVSFQMYDEDVALLYKKADSMGMTVSSLIRRALFDVLHENLHTEDLPEDNVQPSQGRRSRYMQP